MFFKELKHNTTKKMFQKITNKSLKTHQIKTFHLQLFQYNKPTHPHLFITYAYDHPANNQISPTTHGHHSTR